MQVANSEVLEPNCVEVISENPSLRTLTYTKGIGQIVFVSVTTKVYVLHELVEDLGLELVELHLVGLSLNEHVRAANALEVAGVM